jgi:hypothetical protein
MVEEASALDVFSGRLDAPHRLTAARALVEEPFDWAKVLGQLVEEGG